MALAHADAVTIAIEASACRARTSASCASGLSALLVAIIAALETQNFGGWQWARLSAELNSGRRMAEWPNLVAIVMEPKVVAIVT